MTNYQKNGEIADVPPEEIISSQQFAHPRHPTPLSGDTTSQSSIFCTTCLKNQHLYTSALSEFLPEPEDPKYDDCEAALPKFKKHLEERYPQCCAQCEPKVRAQLQKVTYNARSDHLRRMLDRSRERRMGSRLGWRSLVVNAAALGYLSSLGIQLSWHALGAIVNRHISIPGHRVQDCFNLNRIPLECVELPEKWMRLSMILGLVCIWWNPLWQHKLQHHEGRLVGLDTFYKASFAVLILRFLAWILLLDFGIPNRYLSMSHSFFLVLILMVSGWNLLGIISIDSTPIVNWHQDLAPLLSPKQFVPPIENEQVAGTSSSQNYPNHSQPLSLNDLAPRNQPDLKAWQPPEIHETNEDAMDWTPSQETFSPQPRQTRFKPTGPSPFHGTLPAAPARRPMNPKIELESPARKAIGLPPGFFDKSSDSQLRRPQPSEVDGFLAEPKFFPPNANADTGLENIFGKVFSLQDDSTEVRTAMRKSTRPQGHALPEKISIADPTHQPWSLSNMIAAIGFSTLLMAVLIWSIEDVVDIGVPQLDIYILGYSSTITIAHLVLSLVNLPATTQTNSIVLFAIQTAVFAALTLQRLNDNDSNDLLWHKLGAGAVSFLLVQEFYLITLNQQPDTSNRNLDLHRPQAAQASSLEQRGGQSSNRMYDRPFTFEHENLSSSPAVGGRRESFDSNESNDSMTTTSTTSTWKTPQTSRRTFDFGYQFGGNSNLGFGRLLLDDEARTSGSGVAGTRSRRRFVNGR